ncbi:alpha/beta fold hydrolase [Rothia aeria]
MSITYFTGGYAQAPVQTLTTTKGQSFAYRALGTPGSVPIVALVHLAANLDNWDPQLLDLLAAERPIIAVDYAGVGKSTGTAGTTVKNMAEGIIEFLDAAGLETVDL